MKLCLAKTLLCLLFLFCFNLVALADNDHNLWMRKQAAKPVTVVCKQKSATLGIAIQELKDGWQGSPNALVTLAVKSNPLIKGDGYELSASGIVANTDAGILYGVLLYIVQAIKTALSKLTTNLFLLMGNSGIMLLSR